MNPDRSAWLKQNPFVRILTPFAAGIFIHEAFAWPLTCWYSVLASAFAGTVFFLLLPLYVRFHFTLIKGILISLLCFSLGGLSIYNQDIKNNPDWAGYRYKQNDALVLTLLEPPVEKPKSFKCEAALNYIIRKDSVIPVTGKIIVYFRKDSSFHAAYGSRLITRSPLREISNSSNPGGFNYQLYCYRKGITHQAYLSGSNTVMLAEKEGHFLTEYIYRAGNQITGILQKNITGEKERGLAEAMLIGYKNDLDPSLVQSYTDTGVVHIIAISGMHLGLIYWLLNLLLRPLEKRKQVRWIKPVLIIGLLWIFSLMAGAQPSVLRSALMFTFIVLGESLSRKTSVYNSLAASAFLLLCINPFWLWDAGFQLSYLAVLSIIVFMRPVYNLLFIKNKLLDAVWKMNAVTIAAQILTVPVSIYHFHQFPNLFLLTNFVAVPLSSIILLGEILLCALSIVPYLSLHVGKLIVLLIRLMNAWIEHIASFPFATWADLEISSLQAALLYLMIIAAGWWMQYKSVRALMISMLLLLCFATLRAVSFSAAARRKQLIVYNIPARSAVDIIEGRSYRFIGDSASGAVSEKAALHLRRTRSLLRATKTRYPATINNGSLFIQYGNKKIILTHSRLRFKEGAQLPAIDLLILSGKPSIDLYQLTSQVTIRQVVFDSSVPAWKSSYWKKDCDSLHIPCYDVSLNGAFVINLR